MEKTLDPERLTFLEDPLEDVLVGAGSAAGAGASSVFSFFFLTFFSLSAYKQL